MPVSTLYFIHGVLIIFDPELFYWAVAELFFTKPMRRYGIVCT